MRRFLTALAEVLDAGRDVVLAAVVGGHGSTPRSSGARMAVLSGGGILGTIGGGLLEARTMELAGTLFTTGGAALRRYRLNGNEAAALGMACGGDVTVLAQFLAAEAASLALIRDLLGTLSAGREALLVTAFGGPDEALSVLSRRLVPVGGPDGPRAGRFPRLERPETIGPVGSADLDDPTQRADLTGLAGLAGPAMGADPAGRMAETLRLYEPFAPPYTLHLVGAGHVSFFTAKMAALAGFAVTVTDDRADFANPERFPEAEAIHVPDSLDAALPPELGPRDYVAVITRGHVHDRSVLAQALKTRAGYVGMIGSRGKREATYAALRTQGVAEADLDRVRCPIGLAIGAETPEEIAVSITAEIVAVRAGTRTGTRTEARDGARAEAGADTRAEAGADTRTGAGDGARTAAGAEIPSEIRNGLGDKGRNGTAGA